jgi:hypothetical protein
VHKVNAGDIVTEELGVEVAGLAVDTDPKLKHKFDWFMKPFSELSDCCRGTVLDDDYGFPIMTSSSHDADIFSKDDCPDSDSEHEIHDESEWAQQLSSTFLKKSKGKPSSPDELASPAGPVAAEPDPSPLPPPNPPPPDIVGLAPKRAPRNRREEQWGPFKIAKVVSGEIQIGWGASCNKHTNEGDGASCKRQLRYRGRASEPVLDDTECVRQLKRWLLAGMQINPILSDSRSQHVGLPIRHLGPQAVPEDLTSDPAWPDIFP